MSRAEGCHDACTQGGPAAAPSCPAEQCRFCQVRLSLLLGGIRVAVLTGGISAASCALAISRDSSAKMLTPVLHPTTMQEWGTKAFPHRLKPPRLEGTSGSSMPGSLLPGPEAGVQLSFRKSSRPAKSPLHTLSHSSRTLLTASPHPDSQTTYTSCLYILH